MSRIRIAALACAAGLLLPAGCRDGAPPYEPARVVPLEGPERRLTYGYGRDQNPTWSAGSDTVYFSSTRLTVHPQNPHMLARIAITGGAVQVLEAAAHVAGSHGGSFPLTAPVLSPTGERLAYVHAFCTNLPTPCDMFEKAVLRVRTPHAQTNAAGDRGVELTVTNALVRDLHYRPSWSPDGQHISYTDIAGLWIWTVASDTREYVPNAGPGSASAAWSPDGERLAFSRFNAIVVVDPDGGNPVTVAAGEEPAWSPDGQTLYFVSNGWIRRVAREGGASAIVPLTHDGRTPAVSPDGRWLAFTRPKGGPLDPDLDIWVIDLTTP